MESTTKTIGEMTSAELEQHIKDLEGKHKARIRTLKALQRARWAEEKAAE